MAGFNVDQNMMLLCVLWGSFRRVIGFLECDKYCSVVAILVERSRNKFDERHYRSIDEVLTGHCGEIKLLL